MSCSAVFHVFAQDILNILSVDHPDWFVKLDERYNWRAWSSEAAQFSNELPYPYRPHMPCVEHFSAAGMWLQGDIAEERAKLWKYFHDSLDLRPARKHWRLVDDTWIPP